MYKPDEECRQLIMAIKTICTEKGIKPHKLAQKAGISTSTMSYLMNGKTNPQLYTLLAICNVLDVSISDLLSTEKQDGGEESWKEEKKMPLWKVSKRLPGHWGFLCGNFCGFRSKNPVREKTGLFAVMSWPPPRNRKTSSGSIRFFWKSSNINVSDDGQENASGKSLIGPFPEAFCNLSTAVINGVENLFR